MTLRFCWSCVSVLILPCVPDTEHFQALTPSKTVPPHSLFRRDTPLKKTAIAVAVFVLAVSMVLPVVRSVNLSAGKPITIDHPQMADGWPQPPLPPKPGAMEAGTLVADGWPQPPLPPKPGGLVNASDYSNLSNGLISYGTFALPGGRIGSICGQLRIC